jgi:hypothetical protein
MRASIDDATVLADDDLLLCDDARSVVARHAKPHRANWYAQQILKLAYVIEQPAPFVLELDGDTVLLRSQRFLTRSGSVSCVSQHVHAPYFDALARLLGERSRTPLHSFTSHQTVYNRDFLVELVTEIERRNPGASWIEAVMRSVDPDEMSGFSEMELYGQWVYEHHRRSLVLSRFANVPASRERELPATLTELARRFPDLDSVSFHYHVDEDPIPVWRAQGLVP